MAQQNTINIMNGYLSISLSFTGVIIILTGAFVYFFDISILTSFIMEERKYPQIPYNEMKVLDPTVFISPF